MRLSALHIHSNFNPSEMTNVKYFFEQIVMSAAVTNGRRKALSSGIRAALKSGHIPVRKDRFYGGK